MPYTPQGVKVFVSVVTQESNQESGNNARELIFIEKDVVVSWLARAQQASVAVQIVVCFDGAHDIGVNDRARQAVPFLVSVAIGCGKEDHFVLLRNDNKSYLGVEVKSCTCFCGPAIVRISLGARARGKGGKGRGRTSDGRKFCPDNCSEFSFRDAILGSIRQCWKMILDKKLGITDRDRIKFASAVCPSIA